MQISENIQNTNYQTNVGLKSMSPSVNSSQVKNVDTKAKSVDSQNNNVQSLEKSEDVARQINELSSMKEVSVNFQRDEQTGQKIIQFIDSSTREVIKQFPSEEMLKVIQQIDKFMEKHSKNVSVGDLLNEVA